MKRIISLFAVVCISIVLGLSLAGFREMSVSLAEDLDGGIADLLR